MHFGGTPDIVHALLCAAEFSFRSTLLAGEFALRDGFRGPWDNVHR
jgi:hypothetical protein